MKDLKTYLLIAFLLCTGNAFSQSGWVQQTSGITSRLYSVYFANQNTGWASGDSGVILNTTNGGAEWISQNSGTTLPLLSIQFANESTGWAVGGYDDNNPLCSHIYIILRSTNGGANWITQLSGGNGYFFNDLAVVNTQTAYTTNAGICCPPFCIQSSGAVSKTDNSGLNWNYSLGSAFFSVFFMNEMEGWAAGQSSSDVLAPIDYIYKTNNGGNNWQLILSDTAFNYNPYRKIQFVNSLTGYGIKGKLLKSTDGGSHWNNTDSISTSGVSDQYFINSDTGWCTKGTSIIRTNNGGEDWDIQNSNNTSGLSSIYFVDAYYGWAVGSGGTIIKTITGGLTSITQLQTAEIPDNYSLLQNYPNPFNPTTDLGFGISELGLVTLKIYDVLGNEVETLVNENLSPGSYKVKWNGSGFASGIYFYRLTAGGRQIGTKRMILIK